MRLPNKVIRKYTEPFFDGTRHATITKVDYKDKKGKIHTDYVLYVKWEIKGKNNEINTTF